MSVARLSAGCQTELQQVQQELKAQLQLEQELRESLHRAKEEGGIWRENLSKLKSERDRQESELIHVLEQRVQNLERQLRESQLNKEGAHITAIKKFNEQTEQLLRTPVSTSEGGYVALEPLHQLASSEVEESERWTKVLEDVLGKHFDQLDCSVQRILSPN